MKKNRGTVYLVGAGPGDPGLITVRGAELLSKADVVFYDRLANSELLKLAPSSAKKVCVGKKSAEYSVLQEQIEEEMIEEANRGHQVVRLKGGDPFIFGRGGEEALALKKAGIPFEIVPGITSAIGAPAYAGIPLTHRDFTPDVAFVTGHENPEKTLEDEGGEDISEGTKGSTWINWDAIAKMGTVVFLMGVQNLQENMRKLIAYGKPADTPAAVISWGTLSKQKTVVGTVATLANRAEKEGITPPAVVVIGPVASLREKLKWYENK